MSANLPINWADKKNSPLLADFIAKYGAEYCMTAEEINQLRNAVNEMAVIQQSTFLGAAEPAFTPTGTGRAYWLAIKPGTYANHGNVVVAANEIAFIIRDAAGAFSISKTGFDLTSYAKSDDLSILNAIVLSLSSGSPKGTYANVPDLQTAFPTGNSNVYVTTDNGHWYYYNAGWKDGGVYQSPLTTTIKSNESLSLAQRKGDVLFGILDRYTGEELSLSKVTGTPTVDNIIYFQLGTEFFKRNKLEHISVKNFGAKGDGINNDTLAIQTAVNMASKLGFKVFLPSGEYMISSTIQFPFAAGSLAVEISGAKSESSYDKQGVNPVPFSTVIRASQVMPTMFSARSVITTTLAPYAKLNNLLLDGNGLAVNGYINGGQDVIEDLTIFNCSGSGLILETFTNSSVFNRITCVANHGWGAELKGEWSTVSIWNQCKFRGNSLGGMFILNAISSHFADCIYENNIGPGLRMHSIGNGGANQINNLMFDKCYFEQNNVLTGGGHQVYISGEGGTVPRNIIFDQNHLLSGDVGRLGVKILKGDKIRFISPLFTGNNITIANWFNVSSEVGIVSIEGLSDSDLHPTTITIDGAGAERVIIKGYSVLDELGTYTNNIFTANIRKNQVNVSSGRVLTYKEVSGTIITNAGQTGGMYIDLPPAKKGLSFVVNFVSQGDFYFALRGAVNSIVFNNRLQSEIVQYPVKIGSFLRVSSVDDLWFVESDVAIGAVRLKDYTVLTLPIATKGDCAYVTDAVTPSYMTTVVGGGSVTTPVFYNGTNWVCN